MSSSSEAEVAGIYTARIPLSGPLHSLFARVEPWCPELVWLDSAVGDAERGSRSLLALHIEPAVRLSNDLKRAELWRWGASRPEDVPVSEIWDAADQRFASERSTATAGLGWCGWVTYEAGCVADAGLVAPTAPLPFDAIFFGRVRVGIVAEGGATWLLATGASEAEAQELARSWGERLESGGVAPGALPRATPPPPPPPPLRQREAPRAEDHHRAIEAIRDSIAAGDVYQACYTFPVWFDAPENLAPHYLALRSASGGDFGGYVRVGGIEAASTSPERLLRVEGDRVWCRPMKGTRRRSADAEADARLLLELRASEKDRAENVMIVDLVRNDLGRVCEVGSVRVSSLFDVETYATVHQMTSTVEGRLRPGVGPFGVLRAAFPPGSMTGAPKIAACRLLAGLESEPRGLYSGTIGWLGYDGVSELSVVIRTLQRWRERVRWDVGGGIVWESTPAGEWAEAMSKAAALERSGLLGDDGQLKWR